jgi:hypothetical protein
VASDIKKPMLTGLTDLPIEIAIPYGKLSETLVDELKAVLIEHPGPSSVRLHVGTKLLQLPPQFNVDSRNGLVGEIRRLLGPAAILG